MIQFSSKFSGRSSPPWSDRLQRRGQHFTCRKKRRRMISTTHTTANVINNANATYTNTTNDHGNVPRRLWEVGCTLGLADGITLSMILHAFQSIFIFFGSRWRLKHFVSSSYNRYHGPIPRRKGSNASKIVTISHHNHASSSEPPRLLYRAQLGSVFGHLVE